MNDEDYEVTIGTGGWILVVASGLVSFGVLRGLMHFMMFPAVMFSVAIALIVLLALYWLAGKLGADDDADTRRVRKIVPGSAEMRADGAQSAGAPAVKAVPVRPDALKAQRTSSVVTPLAQVYEPQIVSPPTAPVQAPAVAPEPSKPSPVAGAARAETVVDFPTAKVAPKPKAQPKPKAEPTPKAEPKPKASKAATKPAAELTGEPKLKSEPKAKATKSATAKAVKAVKADAPVGLVRLKAPRKGKADDLKEIEGIGPALEKLVNGLGFYHFDQIAAWTDADVATVDAEMKTFKGRITRDKWVDQAKIIVAEGLEAFRERARTNDY